MILTSKYILNNATNWTILQKTKTITLPVSHTTDEETSTTKKHHFQIIEMYIILLKGLLICNSQNSQMKKLQQQTKLLNIVQKQTLQKKE